MNAIAQFILGPKPSDDQMPMSPLAQQNGELRDWWKNTSEATHGVLRFFKLILILLNYLLPSLYIRYALFKQGKTIVNAATELYVLVKLIFPLATMGLAANTVLLAVNVYLLADTIVYLLSVIFLSNVFFPPENYKRSILLLFVNYFQVVFTFAYFYKVYDLVPNLECAIQAIYFSIVTCTTLGYGDFHPIAAEGQAVVIVHLGISILFAALFFGYFVQQIAVKYKGEPSSPRPVAVFPVGPCCPYWGCGYGCRPELRPLRGKDPNDN